MSATMPRACEDEESHIHGDVGLFNRRTISMWLWCQSSDSLAYIEGTGVSGTDSLEFGQGPEKLNGPVDEENEGYQLEYLRELLQKGTRELDVARLNNSMFDEKVQKASELAIALKDKAERTWQDVTSVISITQETVNEETFVKEVVQKATMALSMEEIRLQLVIEASSHIDEVEALVSAQEDIREYKANLENCEAELRRLLTKKAKLQQEADRLSKIVDKAQLDALKAEEDVANIMLLAEQAVAFEMEVAKNDAELAL